MLMKEGLMNQILSWHRLLAMIAKEFIQLRRDRLTFAMMLGVPLNKVLLRIREVREARYSLPSKRAPMAPPIDLPIQPPNTAS